MKLRYLGHAAFEIKTREKTLTNRSVFERKSKSMCKARGF